MANTEQEFVREVVFTGAKTDDEKLAIQTCPGYDGTLANALGDYYEDKDVSSVARQCPKRLSCEVSLHFTPYPLDRLTVYGKCLME